MLRIFLLLITSGICLIAAGQDSLYVKRRLSSSEISVLFSYYNQDGDHSAVTGGIGTEKLLVYAPEINYSVSLDSANTIQFNAGIDFITSASTDRIDYNMSSASYKDANFQFSAGYSRYFKNSGLETGLTGLFSMESDFLSGGFNLWLNYTTKDQNTSFYAGLMMFFDDLRWGRLNPYYRRPVTLVYPVELRDTNWFDIYMRYSYNLALGYERVINRRMMFGIYPGLILQTGLLSTPFHRVYFEGQDSARVENLPRQRLKFPVGFKYNAYFGPGIILNAYYRFFADDFGIVANTGEAEIYYKVTPTFSPSLLFRYYRQSGARYFKPYREHVYSEEYYTSDYDLSSYYSLEAGVGIRFAPFKNISSNWLFEEVDLRYSFYYRSDGLKAHFVSSYFGIGKD